jgi:hypothetical protein
MLGVSKIDNQWYIFDPTWGSGFVNNGKFVNAFDDRYFKANPSEMLLICRLITCGNSLLIPFQIKSFIWKYWC